MAFENTSIVKTLLLKSLGPVIFYDAFEMN